MIVKFSQLNCGEKPTLVLRNLDGTAIQTLGYAFNIEADLSYNEVSTLKFELPATVDGEDVPGYDDVVGMRIIDLVDCGQFILVDPEEESDSIRTVKTCKAYSLEYEFMKKIIYLEAGTYNFFSGIDTSDPNTLVGRIRECLPEWRFDIDESLIGKYRTFDDINKNVYDFIKSDVQKKYGCIFDFDTYERIVHVIDVSSFVPTKQVFLSGENLINKIKTNEDSENIITRLDVNGAEGVTVRSVNPTGTNKIYNLDYFMTTKNFTQEFIDKWRKWEEDCAAKQVLYYDTTMSYNMKLLTILTKEAEISDLEAELVAQDNIRSTKVQLIAQSSSSETKQQQQDELAEVNDKISSLKSQTSSLKKDVEDMKNSAAEIHEDREKINSDLDFSNYFTEEELTILRRYFIDDTLQDNSFVAETASSYIEQDYSFMMNGSKVSVSNAKDVVETIDTLGNTVVSFTSGTLNIESLSAKMIRGTLYFESDGEIVFSGYAENGTIGDASFADGSITVSGNYSSLLTSGTSISFSVSGGRLYFTEKCSEYKQHQIEWELYEYGKLVLYEKASPTYNFDVECCNFLRLEDFFLFQNQLTLGQRIYLNLDEKVLEPFVVSVHVNFDDPTDFSIEFSDTYTSFDQSFHLAKLLDESVATGKTLSYKNGMYSSFVNSGASTAVKDFMDSALDISKNAVLSSANQAISFDDTGIRIRKWEDESKTTYAPEEIWIVDNVIAFTEDNWATSKMAIGKIFDPNFVTSDNPTGLRYGIAAPYLVGEFLIGSNAYIGTEKGFFRVDNSGVYIDSLKFTITHGENGSSNTLEDEFAAIQDRENQIVQDFNDAIDRVTGEFDNVITTYYQAELPSAALTGDLWYVTAPGNGETVPDGITVGKLYRYNGETWQPIEDAGIQDAIESAANAEAIADGKINSYYQADEPAAANEGDIWYVTGNNSKYTKGKLYRYTNGKWEIVEDTNVLNSLKDLADDLKAFEDGLVVTYYQATEPDAKKEGDLWFVTEPTSGETTPSFVTVGKLYRFDDATATWLLIEDASIIEAIKKAGDAQATADKKIVSYYMANTPTDASLGDIWYVTGKNSDGYEEGKLYRYDGTKWQKIEDGDIPAIKEDISSTKDTLSKIINENGYLKADQMQGVINSNITQMKSGTGNVLFDDDGLWLMNRAGKSAATQAIWMNENGIMFGSGSASDDPAGNWEWTTAIGHDGIIAEAIAAGTLSGMKIVGGELNIGNGNFVVDEDGNLTANSGTFKGTVQGASFKTANGTSMMTDDYKFDADYLELKGIEIKNGGTTTFKVDSSTGAVTINGATSISGNIVMNGGSINWDNVDDNGALEKAEDAEEAAGDAYDRADSAYSKAGDAENMADAALTVASDAEELAKDIANGKFSGGTFINGTEIYAPTIYANEFNVMPESEDEEGSFSIYGYFNGYLRQMFSISYYDAISNPATTISTYGNLYFDAPVHFDGNVWFNRTVGEYTEVRGNIDFSNADVKGLTAVFG